MSISCLEVCYSLFYTKFARFIIRINLKAGIHVFSLLWKEIQSFFTLWDLYLTRIIIGVFLHFIRQKNHDKLQTEVDPGSSVREPDSFTWLESLTTEIQWYLGIRPLRNKSNFVYVLFGREQFCLVYDLCLEHDSRARTCMGQNESWHRALLSSSAPYY
jgi:hypothetical protein